MRSVTCGRPGGHGAAPAGELTGARLTPHAVLVTSTDQPGMLSRLTKVLADHIAYVDLTYSAAPENPIR
jgi:hypothetical protein